MKNDLQDAYKIYHKKLVEDLRKKLIAYCTEHHVSLWQLSLQYWGISMKRLSGIKNRNCHITLGTAIRLYHLFGKVPFKDVLQTDDTSEKSQPVITTEKFNNARKTVLKDIISDHHATCRDIAARAGVSYQAVSLVFTTKRKTIMRDSTIDKLLKVFDISRHEFDQRVTKELQT